MRCQRQGTDLKVQIRLAEEFLGLDPHQGLKRMSIQELKEMNHDLATRVRAYRCPHLHRSFEPEFLGMKVSRCVACGMEWAEKA